MPMNFADFTSTPKFNHKDIREIYTEDDIGACTNCKSIVDLNLQLDLEADDRTDWWLCDHCGLELNSDMIILTKNINTQDTKLSQF